MLYTILGLFIGGFASYIIAGLIGVNPRRSFGTSNKDLFVAFGTIIGGCIGFGYGAGALLNGTHPIGKILQ